MKLFFMVFTCFTAFMLAQPAQQQPPFRTAVDLVEVDVTVVDRNGKPVTDLTAADFEIRERGQPQRVDTLFLVTADPALLKNPGAASGPPASTDPAVGDAVPRRPLQPRVFVFIFDMAHLSAAGLDRTRTAVRSFLADGLRPIDLAGLVVNDSGSAEDLDSFGTWGGHAFVEMELQKNTLLQVRYSRFELPAAFSGSPNLDTDAGVAERCVAGESVRASR